MAMWQLCRRGIGARTTQAFVNGILLLFSLSLVLAETQGGVVDRVVVYNRNGGWYCCHRGKS